MAHRVVICAPIGFRRRGKNKATMQKCLCFLQRFSFFIRGHLCNVAIFILDRPHPFGADLAGNNTGNIFLGFVHGTAGGLCYCVWLSCHAFLIVLCIDLELLSVSVRASLFICCRISCSKVVCWFLAYLVGFARLSVNFVEGIKRGRPTCFFTPSWTPCFLLFCLAVSVLGLCGA